MKKLVSILSLAAIAWLPTALSAQSKHTENTLKLDDPANQASVPLDELAWLVGAWHGSGMGGEVQELWAPPTADSLVGLFKMSQGGESSFYEFLLITEDEGGTVLRLKHFNADITGWEEKDDFVAFPLVEVSDKAAYFRGLTYRLVGPDQLEVYLAMRQKGAVNEVEFSFQRDP